MDNFIKSYQENSECEILLDFLMCVFFKNLFLYSRDEFNDIKKGHHDYSHQ